MVRFSPAPPPTRWPVECRPIASKFCATSIAFSPSSRKTRPDGGGPLHEKLHRVIFSNFLRVTQRLAPPVIVNCQRGHAQDCFSLDAKWLAAAGKNLQLGTTPQKRRGQLRAPGDQVLAVVQDQEQLPRAQGLHQSGPVVHGSPPRGYPPPRSPPGEFRTHPKAARAPPARLRGETDPVIPPPLAAKGASCPSHPCLSALAAALSESAA